MDFLNRSNQSSPSAANASNATTSSAHHTVSKRKESKLLRFTTVALLFSATILVISLLLSLFFGSVTAESHYVNKKGLQAVFLNNGQVYFGSIRSMNDKYIRLIGIYYLRVNQTVQPNGQQQSTAPELVALGCELHRPANEMLINRDQVTFWENLKNDTAENTVPGAVKKYLASNPKQDCTQATTQSNTNSTTTPTNTTKKQ